MHDVITVCHRAGKWLVVYKSKCIKHFLPHWPGGSKKKCINMLLPIFNITVVSKDVSCLHLSI
jgi:hypothetical protein